LTKRHQGSGLGLAIAKSLVEQHGGAMRICSRLGKGTMVVVRLPPQAGAMATGHSESVVADHRLWSQQTG
jgi:two-component system cell cycle sensor histidine kinase PleC